MNISRRSLLKAAGVGLLVAPLAACEQAEKLQRKLFPKKISYTLIGPKATYIDLPTEPAGRVVHVLADNKRPITVISDGSTWHRIA